MAVRRALVYITSMRLFFCPCKYSSDVVAPFGLCRRLQSWAFHILRKRLCPSKGTARARLPFRPQSICFSQAAFAHAQTVLCRLWRDSRLRQTKILPNKRTNGVTSIGSFAFSDCSALTSITIPDSVTTIGSSAFANCSALTSITIPDGVTAIETYAFSGCSALTTITIPDSVTTILTVLASRKNAPMAQIIKERNKLN